jgi:hypothetical protein
LNFSYCTSASAAVIGQPRDVPQQPPSAQHGLGHGTGQGLSQQLSEPSAQHGFGQSVVQGVPEQPVDSAWSAIIFGQDAIWAIIGQPAILPDA